MQEAAFQTRHPAEEIVGSLMYFTFWYNRVQHKKGTINEDNAPLCAILEALLIFRASRWNCDRGPP
jgi:hypothetical protein